MGRLASCEPSSRQPGTTSRHQRAWHQPRPWLTKVQRKEVPGLRRLHRAKAPQHYAHDTPAASADYWPVSPVQREGLGLPWGLFAALRYADMCPRCPCNPGQLLDRELFFLVRQSTTPSPSTHLGLIDADLAAGLVESSRKISLADALLFKPAPEQFWCHARERYLACLCALFQKNVQR